MGRRGWRLAACGAASITVVVAGCSLLVGEPRKAPGPVASRPVKRAATSRAAVTEGYDPAKALLPLESIPPAIEMPKPKENPDRDIPPQAIKHYLAARDLFDRWMNAEAIAELDEALRYDPGSYDCHLLLGKAAIRSGNLGQARNHLREAAKLRPDDFMSHYLLGRLAAENGDAEGALRQFRMALRCPNADPDYGDVILTHFWLGEMLLKLGYLSAAIDQLETFEEAIEDARGGFWRNRELLTLARSRRALPPLMIGKAALVLHRYDQAAEAFGRALRFSAEGVDPKDLLEAKVRRAQALARAGRRDEALKVAAEMALSDKEMVPGVELMEWIYRDTGHPEELVGALERLLAEHPDQGTIGVFLANALIALNRTAEAEVVLRRLIRDHPKLMPAYVRLAALLRDEGKLADTVSVLADAIVAGPETHAGVLRAIGQLGSDTKSVKEILDRADQLVAGHEKNYALDYVLGLLATHADRPQLAVRCLSRATELNKHFLPAYLSLGRLYLSRFMWQEAIDIARRAESAGLKLPAVKYIEACAYDGLDRFEPAIAAYEEVIKADPKSVPAMVSLGEMYERFRQPNKARQEYQRALKVAPSNDQAGERLIRLLLAQRDGKEAERVLREFRQAGGGREALGRCLAVMASGGTMSRYRQWLEKLLSQAPKDVDTRYDLAASYYSTQDYDQAGKEADQILALSPGHQKARFLMAELCRKRLDYDSARKILEGLLREHPNRYFWLQEFGEVCLDAQEYDRAAAIFDRLIQDSPNKGRRGSYWLQLIGVYVAAQDYDKAVQAAKGWLKDEPDSATARRLLIEALHEAGQDDRAIALARQWMRAQGAGKATPEAEEKDGEARGLLMTAYVGGKQYEQAMEMLTEWLEKDPTSRSLWRQAWLVLYGAKRYEDAAEICKASIAAGKQSDNYRIMLAQTYLEAEKWDAALAALDTIAGGDNNDLVVRLHIMILVKAKRYDQARKVVEKAISQAQEDDARIPMVRLLVLIHQRQGKMDLATEELEKIYAMRPKDAGANNDLGYTWADAGKHLDKAERMTRFALGEEPRNAAYMDSLGWVLYKKGDFKSAAAFLNKASRTQGGDDPVIFDHLGDAYWRLGKKELAEKSWQRAVELFSKQRSEEQDPSDPEVLPRVRKKLDHLKQGTPPPVATALSPEVSSRAARAEKAEPSSVPAQP